MTRHGRERRRVSAVAIRDPGLPRRVGDLQHVQPRLLHGIALRAGEDAERLRRILRHGQMAARLGKDGLVRQRQQLGPDRLVRPRRRVARMGFRLDRLSQPEPDRMPGPFLKGVQQHVGGGKQRTERRDAGIEEPH